MATDDERDLSIRLKSFCQQLPDDESHWYEEKPKDSARILHRLGCLLKSKCENGKTESSQIKLLFIRSAALLNSAIVREPQEVDQVKKDLKDLCFRLLKTAGANLQNFDLVKFAKDEKQKLQDWRESVKKEASAISAVSENVTNEEESNQSELQKIKQVEKLQDKITEKYKSFMEKISQKCIEVLGNLPCNFALVGMGSLASKNITPYSDFENFIVMQDGVQYSETYHAVLEYFRWYAVIFQVILINFGETLLPCVAIPCLNDYANDGGDWFYDVYTKRGICFDGMIPYACKSPLGRQPTKMKNWQIELIKPASVMAQYLTRDEDLKNGYHLADMLWNTRFVDGSQDVYQMFEKARNRIFENKETTSRKEIIDMIKDDMERYSTKVGISSAIANKSYNVKRFVYRSTTVFVAALARLRNVTPGSSFDNIRRLCKSGLISEEFKHRLLYAVALVCEIRLKIYLEHGYQYDWINSSSETTNEDISMTMIKTVGLRSCYDFLETVCCMQCDAAASGLDDKYWFRHPIEISVAISLFLKLPKRLIAAIDVLKDSNLVSQIPPVTSRHISNTADAAFMWRGSCASTHAPSKYDIGFFYSHMQTFNESITKRSQSSFAALNTFGNDWKNMLKVCEELTGQFSQYNSLDVEYFAKLQLSQQMD